MSKLASSSNKGEKHRLTVAPGLRAAAWVILVAILFVWAALPALAQEPVSPVEYELRLRPLADSAGGYGASYDSLLPALLKGEAEGWLLDWQYHPETGTVWLRATPGSTVALESRPEVVRIELTRAPSSYYRVLASGQVIAHPAPVSQTAMVQAVAPGATYTISGTVKKHNGVAIEDAWVSTRWDDPAYAYAYTDANGAYSLAVNVAGTYHISVSKSGLIPPPDQTVTVPPNGVVNFVFPVTYTVKGTVRDHEGKPVEDASVATEWDDPASAYASTAADGTYTISLIEGRYHLSASKQGYPDSEVRIVAVPPSLTGIDFTLPVTYTIAGTVRDQNGQPVPGATIIGGVSEVTTGPDGSYVTAAGPGETYLYVSKDGYQRISDILVPLPPAAVGVDMVLLKEDGVIRGKVVDGQGMAVADVDVQAQNSMCYSAGSASATTADDGTYTMTVPSGIYQIEASKSGYVEAEPQMANVPSGAAGATVNLQLMAAQHTIRGIVRNYLGQPVSSASVFASACGQSYYTTTGADGSYTLTLGTGTFEVDASKWGEYATSSVVMISTPPSATQVNFILGRLYVIEGLVTTPQGAGIEDASMEAIWTEQSGNSTITHYADSDTTDVEGYYKLLVPAGTYHVSGAKTGYSMPADQIITVPPDQSNVNFTMTEGDVQIQGIVRDAEGQPVNTAYVSSSMGGHNEGSSTRVYYNGTYVRPMVAGTHTVDIYASCYDSNQVREVTLPPSATGIDFTVAAADQLITGYARDTEGTPVCGAGISARATGSNPSGWAYAERNGRYAVWVTAGGYAVRASAVGYGNSPDVAVTVPPFAVGTNLTLTAPPNMIQGTVRTLAGTPLAGVSVVASSASGTIPAASGADGTYIIRVSNGAWTVSASKVNYVTVTAPQVANVPPNRQGLDFYLASPADLKTIALPMLLKLR